MRTLATSIAIALLGGLAFFLVTEGFTAVTSEGARRLAVLRNPAPLPSLRLVDTRGEAVDLAQLSRDKDRVWIADFIYTRCLAVCNALGGSFQQLQKRIVAGKSGASVGLLSISFDPASDSREVLATYGQGLQADPARWRFVRVEQEAELPPLLDHFGVVVIPDGLGGFQHNAALHVIAGGKILRIFDYDQADAALAFALARSAESAVNQSR